jgi:hypothetical protein
MEEQLETRLEERMNDLVNDKLHELQSVNSELRYAFAKQRKLYEGNLLTSSVQTLAEPSCKSKRTKRLRFCSDYRLSKPSCKFPYYEGYNTILVLIILTCKSESSDSIQR